MRTTAAPETRTVAQGFFDEGYRFPSTLVALVTLAVGDVAIAASMVFSLS
jgi:hypothetical protein